MMENKKRLTNVDLILLIIAAKGGRARACEIIKEFRRIRKWKDGAICGMYFARYREQSPFYTLDKDHSVFTDRNTGYLHRRHPDAKVSMWKLTPRGQMRVLALKQDILEGCAKDLCGLVG